MPFEASGTETPIDGMVNQLARLPGIGPKSAQRLAFFLLSLPKKDVTLFTETLKTTRDTVRYCKLCFNISWKEVCHICENPKRDRHRLCIVAEPKELMAIERTGAFRGIYHVLGGLISPIDGIHPDALRIQELLKRLQDLSVSELILALNPTIEGDATALYLTHMLQPKGLKISKLAYGLPMGSDIDYADEVTLEKAFSDRRGIEDDG